MAVYSMTGYATASTEPSAAPSASRAAALHEPGVTGPSSGNVAASPGAVTVELRSVNNRFLDLSFRLPDAARGLEPALREALSRRLRRGKVELRLSSAADGDGELSAPRGEQLARLATVERSVRELLPDARPLSVDEALHWCRGTTGRDVATDDALAVAGAALEALVLAREREGARLATWLGERVDRLRALAAQAVPLVPAAVEKQRARFVERWREALASAGAGAAVSHAQAEERALGEAAAYAIRIDVAEEIGRLSSHLDEITRLLAKGGEVGKRLEFLIQELLREANTLGSKSTSIELTAISVEMKVAIEQLREQVQNVE